MKARAGSAPRGAVIAVAVALFAILALVGVLHHEMWRDEIEIWLIARDSAGPLDLLANMATEGHPSLWYFLNFLLARFTDDPRAMQFLTVLLASAGVCVFLRTPRFPWRCGSPRCSATCSSTNTR